MCSGGQNDSTPCQVVTAGAFQTEGLFHESNALSVPCRWVHGIPCYTLGGMAEDGMAQKFDPKMIYSQYVITAFRKR